MSCNTPGMLSIFYYIKIAMNIIFIAAPVLLLVLGTIDFLGATTASDEKKMKKSVDNFIKRLLICVVILILPLIINTIMNVLNVKSYKECFANATKENIAKLDKEYEAKRKLEEEEIRKKMEARSSQSLISGSSSGRTGIVNIAKGQVGVAEQPLGSNYVKYNNWYYGREVKGSAYPWCAVFVSWLANESGVLNSKIPKFASCRAGVSWFKSRGQWQGKNYTPAPGDLIFYDWTLDGISNHVGIVEYVDGSGIHTIEGNSGDKVSRGVVKSRRNVLGFGVPSY